MEKYNFYAVRIVGKGVYLMVDDSGKKKWTSKKNDCLVFDSESKAIEFAKKYFKSFNNWEVVEVTFAV